MSIRQELARLHAEGRELLATIEADERQAERERQAQLAERMARASEAVARNTAPRLMRSRMTLAEKVAFIGKHGQEAFLAVPWD